MPLEEAKADSQSQWGNGMDRKILVPANQHRLAFSYQQPRHLELIATVPIINTLIDIESETEIVKDRGIKYGYPNNLMLYQRDLDRLASNSDMLNDQLLEIVPPMLVKKEKGTLY